MKMLKILRLQKGDRLKDLANLLGVTESAYHHYESGRVKLDLESAKKLSEYYGVTMDVLLDPHEYDESYVYTKLIKDQPVAEFEDEVELPIVASLQCGYGKSGDPFTVMNHYPVLKSFVKKYGEEIVLCYSSGSSMIPIIRPGDLMVCYPSDWWDDGTIAIVNVNGSDTVKRIYHSEDGGIDLIPDNSEYKMMHFTPQEIEDYHIHVLGHVITTIPPEIQPIPRRL